MEPKTIYKFRAVYIEKGDKFSTLSTITSVMAANHVEAAEEIERQLKMNSGRLPYFRTWEEDGRIIVMDAS